MTRPTDTLPTVSPSAGGLGEATGREHDLKTWPEFYDAIARGEKDFEVRANDRPGGFEVGDVLHLRRFDPQTQQYTGESMRRRVKYVLDALQGFGLIHGYVVMGLEPLPTTRSTEGGEGALTAAVGPCEAWDAGFRAGRADGYSAGRADERADWFARWEDPIAVGVRRERAAIVAWLRTNPPRTTGREHETWADAIARGAHLPADTAETAPPGSGMKEGV